MLEQIKQVARLVAFVLLIAFVLLVVYDAGAKAREREICSELQIYLGFRDHFDYLSELWSTRLCDGGSVLQPARNEPVLRYPSVAPPPTIAKP